ncbi:MAG: DUF2993 domain-containing protein [Snowella sp.]|jgi:hypothetical protein|nr:MAG: DUF2993 domain-containing protein [Snowella sp.]
MTQNQPSKLISKILSPALRLWLRSQVEHADQLDIQIEGQDRQLLRGHVPQVYLTSQRAIYQGLQLGKVLLKGENIRVNIGQVIKGKPLELLEPIQVSGEIQLAETDLQASLTSQILANAFTELLLALLELKGVANATDFLAPYQIHWHAIALYPNAFGLKGTLSQQNEEKLLLEIRSKLTLLNPQTLHLQDIEITGFPGLGENETNNFPVDLGTDVEIETLQLSQGELSCLGRLLIRP